MSNFFWKLSNPSLWLPCSRQIYLVWFIDNKKRRGLGGGGEDTQDPFLVPVTIQIQNRKDPWCLVNSKLRSAKHRELKIAQLGVCWEAPSFQESLEPHVTEDTSSGLLMQQESPRRIQKSPESYSPQGYDSPAITSSKIKYCPAGLPISGNY